MSDVFFIFSPNHQKSFVRRGGGNFEEKNPIHIPLSRIVPSSMELKSSLLLIIFINVELSIEILR